MDILKHLESYVKLKDGEIKGLKKELEELKRETSDYDYYKKYFFAKNSICPACEGEGGWCSPETGGGDECGLCKGSGVVSSDVVEDYYKEIIRDKRTRDSEDLPF